jgi:coenzyme F420 hydrogenase subunit beta
LPSFTDIDPRACTFCGTCVALCPVQALQTSDERIVLTGDCIECGTCYRVCPGRELDLAALALQTFGRPAADPLLGCYEDIYAGRATDQKVRRRAASGGVISAILHRLLRAGEIEGALVVGAHESEPWRTRARLVRSPEELADTAGSRYSLVPLNVQLRELRDEKGSWAVVGLPCHIHGLRKAANLTDFPQERIKLSIGLFCGFNLSLEGTRYLVGRLGIPLDQVAGLRYRQGPWPGGFYIWSRDGRRRFIRKHDYGYLNPMHVPRRCLLCPDLTNELADISVGDNWLEEFRGGWSTLVARSAAGESVIKALEESGQLELTDLPPQRLLASHRHLFDYKKRGYFRRRRWLPARLEHSVAEPHMTWGQTLRQLLLFVMIQVLHWPVVRAIAGRLPHRLLQELGAWGRGAS